MSLTFIGSKRSAMWHIFSLFRTT